MKGLLYLVSVFFINATVHSQSTEDPKEFIFIGNVKGLDNGIVRLIYYDHFNNKLIKDTSILNNGNFKFRGYISFPTIATLIVGIDSPRRLQNPNIAELYLEPAEMKGFFEIEKIKLGHISGSKTQKEFDIRNGRQVSLNSMLDSLIISRKDLERKLSKVQINNSLENQLKLINQSIEELNRKRLLDDYRFIVEYNSSYVAPNLMWPFISFFSIDSVKQLYEILDPRIRNSKSGIALGNAITKKIESQVKSRAKDFTAIDIQGKSIQLNTFLEKNVVLLDFWASWCVPCRKANPRLKQFYSKFHHKGFEIISITYDTDNKAWKKAVSIDKTNMWFHVKVSYDINAARSGKTNKEDILYKYGEVALSTYILIDRDGSIIGCFDSGGTESELERKLDEVFKGR